MDLWYIILAACACGAAYITSIVKMGRGFVPAKLGLDIESAVLVSDLHCRFRPCEHAKTLRNIVKREDCECLVVLGDLFDNFHRLASGSEVAKALASLLGPVLRELSMLVYVTSSASHDPILPVRYETKINGCRVLMSPQPLQGILGNVQVFLTHGEIAILNGAVAHAINKLASLRAGELYIEKKLKLALRLPASTWLIMGHTHIPGIDYEHRVANTGSWQEKYLFGFLPYWRHPSRTYILIADGRVVLKRADEP